MATQQLIDIIIKATDQASATAKKVDGQLKKVYSDVEKANSKAAKSTQKFNTELLRTGNQFQVVGGGAAQAANLLGQMKLDPKFGSTLDRAKSRMTVTIFFRIYFRRLNVVSSHCLMVLPFMSNCILNRVDSINSPITIPRHEFLITNCDRLFISRAPDICCIPIQTHLTIQIACICRPTIQSPFLMVFSINLSSPTIKHPIIS